jgi:hypothetical protein
MWCTQETGFDLGSGFAKGDQPFCVYYKSSVHSIQKCIGLKGLVPFEGELILLFRIQFSVVFFLVRAVHKFDSLSLL